MKKIIPLIITLNLAGLSSLAHSADLLQVYQQAQTSNPLLKQAEAKRNAAYANIGVTRGSLLPQLSLDGSYGTQKGKRSAQGQNITSAQASLKLSLSLFDYSKWSALSIDKKQAAISDINLQLTQQNLILHTAIDYFNVLRAMDSLSLVIAQRNSIYKQYEKAEESYKVGLLAITDMQNAKSQYDQTLANEVTARNSLNNALEKLRQISGNYYDVLNTLNTTVFNTHYPENIATLLDTAHQHNLDIISSKLSKSISLAQIHATESGYMPVVSIQASAALNRAHNFGDNNPLYGTNISGQNQIGVNVSIPIFSGGSTYSATKAANYNYVSSNEALAQVLRTVDNDVYSSYNNILATISSEKANEQAVISAKVSLDANTAGYDVGTRTIVDVLNATTTLYTAKQQLSDARYNYLTSLLQMKFATGTLTEKDLDMLNKELGKPVNMQQAAQYQIEDNAIDKGETDTSSAQSSASKQVTKATTTSKSIVTQTTDKQSDKTATKATAVNHSIITPTTAQSSDKTTAQDVSKTAINKTTTQENKTAPTTPAH